MTNVVFTPALQAPISLGPSAALLSLVGQPGGPQGAATMTPSNVALALAGASPLVGVQATAGTGGVGLAGQAATVTLASPGTGGILTETGGQLLTEAGGVLLPD